MNNGPTSFVLRSLSSLTARTVVQLMSCPHEWLTPSTLDAKGRPVASGTGSASMSPRTPMTLPGFAPFKIPITPVWSPFRLVSIP